MRSSQDLQKVESALGLGRLKRAEKRAAKAGASTVLALVASAGVINV